MTPEEFKTFVQGRIQSKEDQCKKYGLELRGDSAAMTLVGKSFKGVGARPEIVNWMKNGEKVGMFTYDQCKRILKKLEASGV